MSIRQGKYIIASGNSGGGTGNPDELTITINESNQLQAVGTLDSNKKGVVYDWVGTTAEYTVQQIEKLHPDWLCFITDDYSEGVILPDQVGHNGEYLSTDGKNIKWGTVNLAPYQTIANLSQTLDTSTVNYPSNNAVKLYIENNAGSGSVIGDIHYTSRTTVPEGGVWCDGSEITEAQNPKFYKMLVDGEILSTTYTAYNASVASNGSCGFFGLDTVAKAFKVPTLKDVYLKVGTPETFNAESLPNITGTFYFGNGYGLDSKNNNSNGAFRPNPNEGLKAYGAGQSTDRSGMNFDASRSSSTYKDGAKVNPDNVTYRAYVVVSNKSDTTIDIKHEVQLNNPFFFGMYHYFESDPNNASWLISNGNFHSGDTYKGFYQWLVSVQTTPIEGVSVKLNTESYTDFDYVINNGNSTFRLPLKVKGASGCAVKGNGITVGLTDGSGNFGLMSSSFASENGGLFTRSGTYGNKIGDKPSGSGVSSPTNVGITTDPTKSGIVTADDGLKLYFYVGETVQDANMILAGRALSQLVNKIEVKEESYGADANYMYLSNGLLIQWGTHTDGTAFSFPKPFINTNYRIVVTSVNTNSIPSSDCYIIVREKLTTGIKEIKGRTFPVDWFAIGIGA